MCPPMMVRVARCDGRGDAGRASRECKATVTRTGDVVLTSGGAGGEEGWSERWRQLLCACSCAGLVEVGRCAFALRWPPMRARGRAHRGLCGLLLCLLVVHAGCWVCERARVHRARVAVAVAVAGRRAAQEQDARLC